MIYSYLSEDIDNLLTLSLVENIIVNINNNDTTF